jgi:hypothetical protein
VIGRFDGLDRWEGVKVDVQDLVRTGSLVDPGPQVADRPRGTLPNRGSCGMTALAAPTTITAPATYGQRDRRASGRPSQAIAAAPATAPSNGRPAT